MIIAGHDVEYYEDGHIYLVDGIIVRSITSIIRTDKYDRVDKAVLDRAAKLGTEVHEAIERYCKTGEESDLPEVRNFKFLQKMYNFEVMENEKPVILFRDNIPVAVGRLDMVIKIDGKIGGADIKRTSVLDKEYVAKQLNLYRVAYRQSYGVEWEFLRAIHLRGDKRKFVEIPINEELTNEIIRGIT